MIWVLVPGAPNHDVRGLRPAMEDRRQVTLNGAASFNQGRPAPANYGPVKGSRQKTDIKARQGCVEAGIHR